MPAAGGGSRAAIAGRRSLAQPITGMGDPMDASVASKPASLSERPTETETEPPRLSRGASLILILALSLGLWAAIWVAVAALASLVD